MISPDSAPISELPRPALARFQPLRCGLINIYRYDEQEFRFEQGRLLVRGNNGTGKSRVLALTLPFLLDGEIEPTRVEPDKDRAKRMEWNLLLGHYPDRTGYTWIEFGRQVTDGNGTREEFVTLGCGMRAIKDQGAPTRWYFVTDQRMGRDFNLVSAEPPPRPLSREQLEVLLEGRGRVFKKPDEYRAEVDARLFRLKKRYGSLLQLLIQLRQPQLARELKEDTLSRALSDALAPLDDKLLDDVAEAFRALDTERDEMDKYVATREAVGEFHQSYSAYLRCAARRRAAALRRSHRAYEEAQRLLKGKQEEVGKLRDAAIELGEAVRTTNLAFVAASAELEALEGTDAVRSLRGLQEARAAAKRSVERSVQDASVAAQARENEASAEENLREKERHSSSSHSLFEARRQEASSAAQEALLAAPHDARWAPPAPPEQDAATANKRSRDLEQTLALRSKTLSTLKSAVEARDAAQRLLEQAEAQKGDLDGRLVAAEEQLSQARELLRTQASAALASLRAWASALRHLKLPSLEDQDAAVELWCEQARGDAPWIDLVKQAERAAVQEAANEKWSIEQRSQELEKEISGLVIEEETLKKGVHEPPLPPYTRTGTRVGRPGAPLWLLCEFRDEVSVGEQASIEAALESAGLLDAWVTPEGGGLRIEAHDTWLNPGLLPSLADELSLVRWLRPAKGALVDEDGVWRLLRSISCDPQSDCFARIGADGSWTLGPLHGTWSKPAAQHIGEARREEEKLRRLAEIAGALSELRGKVGDLARRVAELTQREGEILAEAAAAPTDAELRDTGAKIASLAEARQRTFDECASATRTCETRRRERDEKHASLVTDASDLRLPDCVSNERIDVLKEALATYREANAGLVPLSDAWSRAVIDERAARTAFERVSTQATQLGEAAAASAEEAVAAQAKCAALESTLGMGEAELMAKVQEVEKNEQDTRAAWDGAKVARGENETKIKVAEVEAVALQSTHDTCDKERRATVAPIHRLMEHGLLREGSLELGGIEAGEWSITRAVQIAREIEDVLRDNTPSDEADWSRHLNAFRGHFQDLQDDLQARGYRATYLQPDEGIYAVTATFQNKPCSMTDLLAALETEITIRGKLLDGKEKEVIENHLLGEVCVQLQDRITSAEKDVENINAELHSRPNSTGLRLRFKWEPLEEGLTGLESARAQLRRLTELWTPEERVNLATFLQNRIRDVKAATPVGTALKEQLAKALDYREWHRFVIEREQDGTWKKLTRKVYGTGSGGEKALMLTLPQVAAAAAHYRSAAPEAPRLILLDEVFVGIDNDARAKCLGLLAAFDLDVVMTSEREWGTYPTVPGLAIYQLATRQGIDAIGVTRWVWNGRELNRDKS